MKKRILSAIAAIILIVTTFASCNTGNTESDAKDVSVATSATESLVENSKWKYDPKIPESFDGEGKDFTFLVVGGDNEAYHSVDIGHIEELEGDLIYDAVQKRNQFVEEELNIKIKVEFRLSTEISNEVRNTVNLQDQSYDVVMPFMNDASTLAMEGFLRPLNTIDTLQLEAEWWDQNANAQLTVGDALYFTTGDISMLDNDCTQSIMFSMDLVNSLSLTNPYDLLRNDEWTFDNMISLAKDATSFDDQYPTTSYKNRWGLHINGNGATGLFLAAGEKLTTKDSTDYPVIALDTSRAVSVFAKIFDIMHDKSYAIIIEDYNVEAQADGFQNCYRAAAEQIAKGNALFRVMSMSDTDRLLEYNCNYGILPMPKFDEDQDRYYALVSTLAVPGVCIPVTNDESNMKRTGYILDAMAAKAKEDVTYAYYDVKMKNRIANDLDARYSLDLIFDSTVYDLGVVYNWGGIRGFINDAAIAATNNYTSKLDAAKDSIELAIDATVSKFKEQ